MVRPWSSAEGGFATTVEYERSDRRVANGVAVASRRASRGGWRPARLRGPPRVCWCWRRDAPARRARWPLCDRSPLGDVGSSKAAADLGRCAASCHVRSPAQGRAQPRCPHARNADIGEASRSTNSCSGQFHHRRIWAAALDAPPSFGGAIFVTQEIGADEGAEVRSLAEITLCESKGLTMRVTIGGNWSLRLDRGS